MYENQDTTEYQFSSITEVQSFKISSLLETSTPEPEHLHIQPTSIEYLSTLISKTSNMKSENYADDTVYLSPVGQSGYSLYFDISTSRTENIYSQELQSTVIATTLDYMPQATIQPINLAKEVTRDFQSLTSIEASHLLLTEIYHSDNLLSNNYLTKSDMSVPLTSEQIGPEKQITDAINVSMSSPSHHMQSLGIITSNVLDQSLRSTSTITGDHFKSTKHLGLKVNNTQHFSSVDPKENAFTLYGPSSPSVSYAPTEQLFTSYVQSSSSTAYISSTSIFPSYDSSSTPSPSISPENLFTFTSYGPRSASTSSGSSEKLSTSYDPSSFPTSHVSAEKLFTSYAPSSTFRLHVSTEKLSTPFVLNSFPTTSNIPSHNFFTPYGEGSTSSSYAQTQKVTNIHSEGLITVPDTLLSIPWSHQISHVSAKPTPHISMTSSEIDVSSIIYPSPYTSTSSSVFTVPVACHVTEHVLIDNYGKMTVNIPYFGKKRICTWLLLAKKNRVIALFNFLLCREIVISVCSTHI